MITFLLGFTLGTIFGVVGLVCAAIMYDKHHPDEQKRMKDCAERKEVELNERNSFQGKAD